MDSGPFLMPFECAIEPGSQSSAFSLFALPILVYDLPPVIPYTTILLCRFCRPLSVMPDQLVLYLSVLSSTESCSVIPQCTTTLPPCFNKPRQLMSQTLNTWESRLSTAATRYTAAFSLSSQ